MGASSLWADWLALGAPFLRFESGCSGSTNECENANSWKKRKNSDPPTTYSPAKIDPGFVKIIIVQLSPSVKATNSMSHIYAQTNQTRAPCTHPGTSSEVNDARGGIMLAAGRVRSKKRNEYKKQGKIRHHTRNTLQNPQQQPGDRVQPETACEERRHKR